MPEEIEPANTQSTIGEAASAAVTGSESDAFRSKSEGVEPTPENDDPELTALMAESIHLMEPGFTELISDETRKAQTRLVLASFGVILLASKAVTASGTVKSNGFEMNIATHTLLIIGTIAVGYFEMLATARWYADWRLYKLKTAAADRELKGYYKDSLRKLTSIHCRFPIQWAHIECLNAGLRQRTYVLVRAINAVKKLTTIDK
jgi:hypothetical protein